MDSQLSPAPGPPALVVVAHGSRDPRALATVRALLDRVRALRPGLPVHLGHIELNEPLLPDTLTALGEREAVLVPLLLSRGYHVKRDIPEMAAEARLHTRVAAPLGPHPLLADALHARLTEAGWPTRMDDGARRTSGVVLAEREVACCAGGAENVVEAGVGAACCGSSAEEPAPSAGACCGSAVPQVIQLTAARDGGCCS